jgi:flagella basal body P-ring formation protein FlgA
MKGTALAAGLLLFGACARAGTAATADPSLADSVRELARQGAAGIASAHAGIASGRVEVELGRLDPRLRLAPCDRIEPHLPPGTRLWGRSRIGLRCAAGATRWNVYVPVVVKVFGRAVAARTALAAGTTLAASDLTEGTEVDFAAERGTPIGEASALVGRRLMRDLPAGAAVRDSHLEPRRWFGAGESVRIVAAGSGWQIAGEGVALGPGLEGTIVRVRTDSGRIVSGRAAGPRTIEVSL